MLQRHGYRPTETEIAWAAGLYEGEGTIIRIAKVGKNGGPSSWMSIRMTDREPIEEMVRIFGGSFSDKIASPAELARGAKVKYGWRVNAWRDIIRVVEAIYPHLSPRRKEQMDAVMAHRPKHPRGELACPPSPFPSVLGYKRHWKLGLMPACDICLESVRLYEAAKRLRNAEAIAASNRVQYAKNREARIAYQRAYNARRKAERQKVQTSEIMD